MSPEPRTVQFDAGGVSLEGTLTIPNDAFGVVLFAHGSGSSRFSPRNWHVASILQVSGLATLLIDLLSQREEAIDAQTGNLRFDIPFLAQRLIAATNWLTRQESTRQFPVGYFGASTGGGAALVAATERPDAVRAVVSRGGRPDLAGAALLRVQAPTLLIVGGNDPVVLDLNRDAQSELRCEKQLAIVPGASHLFEEPGTLDAVARLAADWFVHHLASTPTMHLHDQAHSVDQL